MQKHRFFFKAMAIFFSAVMVCTTMTGFTYLPYSGQTRTMSAQSKVLIENQAEKLTSINDLLLFGDRFSEQTHQFNQIGSVAGKDTTLSKQITAANGLYEGGGLGHGLTYRQLLIPTSKDTPAKLEFTLNANPAAQNYVTIRFSGSQYDRGNLMLYGPSGNTTILNPRAGREYSELDNGYYNQGPVFEGRYYYSTYKIPQGMVDADGKLTLSIMQTGRMDAYGTSTYKPVTQNSRYIYSIASHTEPYYSPEDEFRGTTPTGSPVAQRDISPYEYLQGEMKDMTELILSWQLYGEEWEQKKTRENLFMDGAIIRNVPITEAKLTGSSDEVARRYTLEAINHQNWSTMSNLLMLANTYMFDFSGKYYQNDEILYRYIALLDFYQRAQDQDGGWCYYTTGENKGKWIGVSLEGNGSRGKGENWPLLSLGVDAMMQSFIQLNDYIMNSGNTDMIQKYQALLDEKIDGSITGDKDRTRRDTYIDMFGRLRERLANPKQGTKGDFYSPQSRAGTANQDFGFAHSANKIIELLEKDSKNQSNTEYHAKDSKQYVNMILYKYGEMADGQKWFSTKNSLGLEGGASHGGWAGDYGTLLIGIANKYAENARYFDKETQQIFNNTAYNTFESAKYFYYPGVDENGNQVLMSELFASSRNNGYGQKIVYPIAGYTALELGSSGAFRFLSKYISDNRAYTDTLREDIENKSPHVYTRMTETQDILKYYQAVKNVMEKEEAQTLLPMEQGHEDFVFYDTDGQVIVFKNKEDKGYVTFNYRREDWTYNDNTRIHFIQDDIDRLADVKGTHQGGLFVWNDNRYLTQKKNPTKHTRFDGMSETRYGKYIFAINQSKTDKKVGQTGQTYTLTETTGVTRARDLISGKIYENSSGITVDVLPSQAVALEILESLPANHGGAIYVEGNRIIDSSPVYAPSGSSVTLTAKAIDGYKLVSEKTQKITISSNERNNLAVFQYEKNEAPKFTAKPRDIVEADWQVLSFGNAKGEITTDESGMINSISSRGITGKGNLEKTFAYKEVTGDFEIHARLDYFDRTATDSDYFGIFVTDSLELEQANFAEERHFSNNNNILLVSHKNNQENNVTSYWAGDMNNKAVPIHFIIKRTGNTIEYWYSLDEGKTYLQTSKPKITHEMKEVLYVGVSMTAAETGNTAHISQIELKGEKVGKPIAVGQTAIIDFTASDFENDPLTYTFSELPQGASITDNIITFTPDKQGEYIFQASVNDSYHNSPIVKTIKINVGS
ncbi:hypothetical protein [Clostridium sp. HBUAS56010]|uniref:hypothetical protein n=1 Tax=Clostridium sp. HBUAS56010 TaxID=2571127 RepID=UPI0011777C8A|nr:hypothetical protein [Clostridium sp. HBUAS56010]